MTNKIHPESDCGNYPEDNFEPEYKPYTKGQMALYTGLACITLLVIILIFGALMDGCGKYLRHLENIKP